MNAYLHEAAGESFTAKDFRTWAGTVFAALALKELAFETQAEAKRNVVAAIESVAARLGNTPSVCRKCYVHPAVVEAYLGGSLAGSLTVGAAPVIAGPHELTPEEAAVLAFLRGRPGS